MIFFLQFIKQNQIFDFILDYERWFYQEGETIIQAGTIGQEAFLLIDGTAEVIAARTNQVIGKISEGDIFGELALLTDEPRSADIVAVTNAQLMVLSKSAFLTRYLNQPEQALNLMRLLGKRTQSLIHQLEKSYLNENL